MQIGVASQNAVIDVEPIEARPAAERLAGALGLNLPVAVGGDRVAEDYRVTSLPELVLIKRDGTIGRILLGIHGEHEIAALLDEALK